MPDYTQTLDPGTGANPAQIMAQQEELARRRKLMDAMTAQNMQSQVQGSTYGLGQALTKLATAYILSKKGKEADADAATNRQAYSAQLGKEAGSFADRMAGHSAAFPESMDRNAAENMEAPGSAMPQYKVAGDPKQAIIQAMTSQLPEMQNLGKSMIGNLNKQQMTPDEILKLPGFTPTSKQAAAMSGDLSQLRPLADVHTVNNQLVSTTEGGAPQRLVDARDKFTPVGPVAQGPNGPIIGQTEKETGKADFAPAGQTINIDNFGNKQALESATAMFKDTRETATSALGGIREATTMWKLAHDPQVLTGFGANAGLGLAAAGAKLGLNGPDAAAKTQALVANLAARTLEAGQKMKGSFSDKDIEFLKGVSDGSITLTPQVLQHAAGLSIAGNHNALIAATQQRNEADSIPGIEQISKLYSLPKYKYAVPDDKRFKFDDDTHQISFASPLFDQGSAASPARPNAAAAPGQPPRVIPLNEFLGQ